ncbi:DMT family transporter [Orrella sp. 11846]|uniref:DMT family transporter n=1 Tax=Orrella sp. 11846 TaxID=3409913 RepID=UPI003B5B710A
MSGWIYLTIAIVAEVIATSALKFSDGFTRLMPSVLVVIGYAVTFYCLSIVLRTVHIGVAYAVWSGLGIVLIAAFGWIAFGQKLDGWAILGIALILAGVVILNLLSKTGNH